MQKFDVRRQAKQELEEIQFYFNPIQDGGGGGAKRLPLPTSFSPVTSTNVGFGP